MKNSYQTGLEKFYSQNKRMPTYTEMMKLWSFKSKNAVAKVVNKLLDAGLVTKDHLGRLLPASSFGEIVLGGLVKAGPPSETYDLQETVNLEDMLIGRKEITYMMQVDGDSMIEAHIEDGDMVLIEKNKNPKDMDIVLAEVDGEFTLKYYREQGGKKWLQPANKNYKDIHPAYSFEVDGVVKAVIRKY